MSITTRGWGNGNITTSGWGYRWLGPVKKVIKNFILYITNVLDFILGIEKDKVFNLYISRELDFDLFIDRSLEKNLYIVREISFELQIDPKEI